MWVCHCRAVTDRDVKEAIDNGASDEVDVAMACGAGTGCGSCIDTVRSLCAEAQACPAAARVLLAVGD